MNLKEVLSEIFKNKILRNGLILLLNVCFVSVSLGVTTYAWFISKKTIDETVNADSGNIKINTLTTTGYKYDFVALDDSGLYYDYNSGSVNEYSLNATDGYTLKMNRYDPVYLYINDSVNLTDLMTNLVLKMSFSITADCDYTFDIATYRKTSTIPTGYTAGIANYLDFCSITSTDLANITLDTTYDTTKETTFYKVKKYGETTGTTKTHFYTDTDPVDKVIIYSPTEKISSFNKNKTTSFEIYFNIEYNETTLASYIDDDLFTPLKLYMDYAFIIEAEQVN